MKETLPLPSPHETVRKSLGTISARDTQRFAIAIGDDNPVYFDDAYARSCGYRGIIAPPTYLAAVLGWEAGPAQEDLLPDGNDPDAVPEELKGMRLMGGGQDITFMTPLYPGDEIWSERNVVELFRKVGRSGSILFSIAEVRFFNQREETILICRETLMAR